MCVHLITQLLWLLGKLVTRNWFKHTIRVAVHVVTPTDRPKSVCNCFGIEVYRVLRTETENVNSNYHRFSCKAGIWQHFEKS